MQPHVLPTAFSDKPLPPPHAERTQSSTSSQIKRDNQDSVIIQRSRGPLPPQSTAMRLGNRKRPEDISQGISQKHQTPEQAPRGPRADRERVSGRVTPPLASADRAPQHQRQDRSIEPQSYTERGSISRTERGRQGDAPKPDVTERHTGTTSRSSQQPGQGSSREFVSLMTT